jgi:hypothetical protein
MRCRGRPVQKPKDIMFSVVIIYRWSQYRGSVLTHPLSAVCESYKPRESWTFEFSTISKTSVLKRTIRLCATLLVFAFKDREYIRCDSRVLCIHYCRRTQILCVHYYYYTPTDSEMCTSRVSSVCVCARARGVEMNSKNDMCHTRLDVTMMGRVVKNFLQQCPDCCS